MPPVFLYDNVSAELRGRGSWPSDVKLFQPRRMEQILLHDSAACLSAEAFLLMCNLDFSVEERANAEYMSPTGKVPFIKAGAFVISELDRIVSYASLMKATLTAGMNNAQKADMRAYMSLVNNVLGSAEMYVSWLHEGIYTAVTQPRYSSVYPWPLSAVLTYMKRRGVKKNLNMLGWGERTIDEVYAEVNTCCLALSQRLDNQNYFFGNSPCELDALVFGHLYTLIVTLLPDVRLAAIVYEYPSLIDLCRRIERTYFNKDSLLGLGGTAKVLSSNPAVSLDRPGMAMASELEEQRFSSERNIESSKSSSEKSAHEFDILEDFNGKK